jgi:hypothetical protein
MDSILSRIAKTIIYNINIKFFRFPSDLPSGSFQKLSLNQYISLLQLPPSKLRVHSKLQQPPSFNYRDNKSWSWYSVIKWVRNETNSVFRYRCRALFQRPEMEHRICVTLQHSHRTGNTERSQQAFGSDLKYAKRKTSRAQSRLAVNSWRRPSEGNEGGEGRAYHMLRFKLHYISTVRSFETLGVTL